MRTAPASARDPDNHQLLTVLTALKKGDFTVRMPVDYTGIPGKIADALNDVIEQQAQLTKEVRRISSVVGKEGKTSQRASFDGVKGSWGDCIDAVNNLIVDLVQPTTEVARVIGAVANGDLSQTMALDIDGRRLTGEFLRTAKTINTMVGQLNGFASEVTRVAREVGTEGKLGGQADVKGVAGTWKDLTDSVNFMASNLTSQVRNIAEVTTAVATGDLSKKITADAKGEILELKNTVNTMVEQLNAFASEVTRVAREVGTEGKLGGQADVKGVAGTWKDLTDSVNFMASNLTGQVRNIAEVTTAVATGDLSKKITADAKGEILELKNTVNIMVDQLNAFASEVTRVAREVGTEGKLGGQAERQGRLWHLEGPDRQRQLHGEQPHRPGTKHRRGRHGHRHRRPLEEDHGGRQGRDPRAQEHHQHHAGPVELLFLRGDARRPRGGHRGQARRSGHRQGRLGHLEGLDR